MKISTKEIYEEYIAELSEEKKALISDKDDFIASRSYLLSKLAPYKHYLDHFTNIKYNDVKDMTRVVAEKSLIHLANMAGCPVDNIRRTVNMIAEINKSINVIDEKIENIGKLIKKYNIFQKVIFKFNVKVSNLIVSQGYVLYLGSGLGHVRIKKVNCMFKKNGDLKENKRIDWNESNKKKAEIIARGGIPYKVMEREGDKIVKDNGGERWFVYFNYEWDYLWYWSKGIRSVMNSSYYKFRPTIYNNTSRYKDNSLGNVNKLKQLVTCNSPLLTNFSENISDFNATQLGRTPDGRFMNANAVR